MQKYNFNFTTCQLQKIAAAYKKKSTAVIQLAYENLVNGKYAIILYPENAQKVEKAKKSKKGLRLVLTYNEIKDIKQGGFLPLLFAGLGALGAIAGGASAIANAVINKKEKDKELEELKRHNKVIEGKGLKKRRKKK